VKQACDCRYRILHPRVSLLHQLGRAEVSVYPRSAVKAVGVRKAGTDQADEMRNFPVVNLKSARISCPLFCYVFAAFFIVGVHYLIREIRNAYKHEQLTIIAAFCEYYKIIYLCLTYVTVYILWYVDC
jgi:hypothetical protein